MIFDPFGDFDTHGYLRNHFGLRCLDEVKNLERISFLDGLSDALEYLANREEFNYDDVLQVHRILFDSVYPWAGSDRAQTAPGKDIKKNVIVFAQPHEIRLSIDHALRCGQDLNFMTARPGEVMGYLAYGHPFLDGNGRVIMTVHAELARRAGISVTWHRTAKDDYLSALTQELCEPNKGHLDRYLQPFVDGAIERGSLFAHLSQIRGLNDQITPAETDPSIGGDQ